MAGEIERHGGGRAPTRPAPRQPGPRRTDAAGPPTYAAGTIGSSTAFRSRHELWPEISAATRERLQARAGLPLFWLASDTTGPPPGIRGIVLGTNGLAVSDPTVTASGGRGARIRHWPADPASHRKAQVDGPGHAARTTAGAAAGSAAGSAAPPGSAAAGLALPARDLGVLGNLPDRAQVLLTAPFTGPRGHSISFHHWYWEGPDERCDFFAFVITGNSDITAAVGTMAPAPGGRQQWSLACHRLTVQGKGGKGTTGLGTGGHRQALAT